MESTTGASLGSCGGVIRFRFGTPPGTTATSSPGAYRLPCVYRIPVTVSIIFVLSILPCTACRFFTVYRKTVFALLGTDSRVVRPGAQGYPVSQCVAVLFVYRVYIVYRVTWCVWCLINLTARTYCITMTAELAVSADYLLFLAKGEAWFLDHGLLAMGVHFCRR